MKRFKICPVFFGVLLVVFLLRSSQSSVYAYTCPSGSYDNTCADGPDCGDCNCEGWPEDYNCTTCNNSKNPGKCKLDRCNCGYSNCCCYHPITNECVDCVDKCGCGCPGYVAPPPQPTATPTPCPACCSAIETRQEQIDSYCASRLTNCPAGYANPMTCYGGQNPSTGACEWWNCGANCGAPYCVCACAPTPTPTPTPCPDCCDYKETNQNIIGFYCYMYGYRYRCPAGYANPMTCHGGRNPSTVPAVNRYFIDSSPGGSVLSASPLGTPPRPSRERGWG